VSAEDIAERMRTGAALQQALREMEAIMRNAPVGIIFTRDRRIVQANAKFNEIFRFVVAAPLLSQGRPFQTQMPMRSQDGSDVWINLIGYVQNTENTREGTIWICEDRSSVKRTEEALKRAHAEQQLILENSVVGIAFIRHRLFQRCNRRLEEMYGWGRGELDGRPTRVPRAILDSANLIILSTDRGGHIVSCNPAAEQLLGLPAADMLGRLPTELCFDAAELDAHRQRLQQETGIASPTAMAALTARAHLGQIDEGEWTLKRADGTRFPAQVTISPLREGESQVLKGFLLVAGDITGRKQAEALLVRSRDELEARVRERTSELHSEVEQRQRAEQRLRRLALYDALTGLPNRALPAAGAGHRASRHAGQLRRGAVRPSST